VNSRFYKTKLVRFTAHKSRVLALLLLVSFAYGANAEITHSHGLGKSTPRSLETQISSRSESPDSKAGSLLKSDCLICQLHQHLGVGTLPVSTRAVDCLLRQPAFVLSEISYRSLASTISQGRGPPAVRYFA
jgi:hypothetical protein